MDTRYNGWTNYATWLVYLQIFRYLDIDDCVDNIEEITADWVFEYIDYMVFEHEDNNGFLAEYARAFLSEVNHQEIAQSLIDNYNG